MKYYPSCRCHHTGGPVTKFSLETNKALCDQPNKSSFWDLVACSHFQKHHITFPLFHV